MTGVVVRPATPQCEAEAVRLLARAFITNPIHVAALGAGELARNEVFFRVGLSALKGVKLVALQEGRVVGFNHWVRYPGCIISPSERIRLTPTLMRGIGLGASRRTVKWVTAWGDQHPVRPHVHLGPLGVDPALQRRGVGSLLMEAHVAALIAERVAGYLETDRPENVGFYRRFGFELVGEVTVLDVPNYFMWRAAG